MAIPGKYIVNFTNTDKDSFTIGPYVTNGPVSPTAIEPTSIADTSLFLYGKAAPNYGERLQEDMVYLLENFAGPATPVNAIEGQLWYLTKTFWKNSALSYNQGWYAWVYNDLTPAWEWQTIDSADVRVETYDPNTAVTLGTYWYNSVDEKFFQYSDFEGTSLWRELKFDTLNTAPPADPRKYLHVYTEEDWVPVHDAPVSYGAAAPSFPITGDLWYNPVAFEFSLWNGTTWELLVPDVTNYLKLDGTNGPMTGALILHASPTGGDPILQAATKEYVDGVAAAATTDDIINLSGVTGASASDALDMLNATFSLYVPTSGATMTGALYLSGDPTNNLQAATKKYVDDLFITTGLIDVYTTSGSINPTDGILSFNRSDGSTYDVYDVASFSHTHTPADIHYPGANKTNGLEVLPQDTNNIPSNLYLAVNALEQLALNRTERKRKTVTTTTYAIVAVSTTNDQFSLAGDYTLDFMNGYQFEVTASTGNDGTYTAIGDTEYEITDMDISTRTISIFGGDYTADFPVAWEVIVTDTSSYLNDTTYTVSSVSYNGGTTTTEVIVNETFPKISSIGHIVVKGSIFSGGNTVIRAVENVVDATVDGNVEPLSYSVPAYPVGQNKTLVFLNGQKYACDEPASQEAVYATPIYADKGSGLDATPAEVQATFAGALDYSTVTSFGDNITYQYTAEVDGVSTVVSITTPVTGSPYTMLDLMSDPDSNFGAGETIVGQMSVLGVDAFIENDEIFFRTNSTGRLSEHLLTGGDPVTDTFEIADDQTTIFVAGREFRVVDSDGTTNDGYWTVQSSSYNGSDTTSVITTADFTGTITPGNGYLWELATIKLTDSNFFSSLGGFTAFSNSISGKLDDGNTTDDPFTFSVLVDGADTDTVEVKGRDAISLADLIILINKQLIYCKAELDHDRIRFISNTQGSTASIVVTDGDTGAPFYPNDERRLLHFLHLNNFRGLTTTSAGVSWQYAEVGTVNIPSTRIDFPSTIAAAQTLDVISTGENGFSY